MLVTPINILFFWLSVMYFIELRNMFITHAHDCYHPLRQDRVPKETHHPRMTLETRSFKFSDKFHILNCFQSYRPLKQSRTTKTKGQQSLYCL